MQARCLPSASRGGAASAVVPARHERLHAVDAKVAVVKARRLAEARQVRAADGEVAGSRDSLKPVAGAPPSVATAGQTEGARGVRASAVRREIARLRVAAQPVAAAPVLVAAAERARGSRCHRPGVVGGVIARLHGTHCFPDTTAHGEGENPQPLYSVRFTAQELWGPAAPAGDQLFIDLWEDYLEAQDV